MKAELEAQLVKDFPLCFGDYGKDMKQTCMYWGCECGDGWYGIIREACEKAEPIIAKWMEDNKDDNDFAPRFAQVKEKYGTLRLYFTTYPDGINDIEMEAEERSANTCQECGEPGKLFTNGWYYTACWDHTKVEDRGNLGIIEQALDEKEKRNG